LNITATSEHPQPTLPSTATRLTEERGKEEKCISLLQSYKFCSLLRLCIPTKQGYTTKQNSPREQCARTLAEHSRREFVLPKEHKRALQEFLAIRTAKKKLGENFRAMYPPKRNPF